MFLFGIPYLALLLSATLLCSGEQKQENIYSLLPSKLLNMVMNFCNKETKYNLFFTCKHFHEWIKENTPLYIALEVKRMIHSLFVNRKRKYHYESQRYTYEKLNTRLRKTNLDEFKKDPVKTYYFMRYFFKYILLYNPNLQFRRFCDSGKTDYESAKTDVAKIISFLKQQFFHDETLVFLKTAYGKWSLEINTTGISPWIFQLLMQKGEKRSQSLLYHETSNSREKSQWIPASIKSYVGIIIEFRRPFGFFGDIFGVDSEGWYPKNVPVDFNSVEKLFKTSIKKEMVRQLSFTTAPGDIAIFDMRYFNNCYKLFIDSNNVNVQDVFTNPNKLKEFIFYEDLAKQDTHNQYTIKSVPFCKDIFKKITFSQNKNPISENKQDKV